MTAWHMAAGTTCLGSSGQAAAREVLRQAGTEEPPRRRNTVHFPSQGGVAVVLNMSTIVSKPGFSLVLNHRDASSPWASPSASSHRVTGVISSIWLLQEKRFIYFVLIFGPSDCLLEHIFYDRLNRRLQLTFLCTINYPRLLSHLLYITSNQPDSMLLIVRFFFVHIVVLIIALMQPSLILPLLFLRWSNQNYKTICQMQTLH